MKLIAFVYPGHGEPKREQIELGVDEEELADLIANGHEDIGFVIPDAPAEEDMVEEDIEEPSMTY